MLVAKCEVKRPLRRCEFIYIYIWEGNINVNRKRGRRDGPDLCISDWFPAVSSCERGNAPAGAQLCGGFFVCT